MLLCLLNAFGVNFQSQLKSLFGSYSLCKEEFIIFPFLFEVFDGEDKCISLRADVVTDFIFLPDILVCFHHISLDIFYSVQQRQKALFNS